MLPSIQEIRRCLARDGATSALHQRRMQRLPYTFDLYYTNAGWRLVQLTPELKIVALEEWRSIPGAFHEWLRLGVQEP